MYRKGYAFDRELQFCDASTMHMHMTSVKKLYCFMCLRDGDVEVLPLQEAE